MKTIYDLKPAFQNLLRPVSDWCAACGISPNAVTLTALALSCGEGFALQTFPGARGPLLCLPLVLFVRMALNAIDGMIAREHQRESVSGKYLNEVGDILSDLVLYAPFLIELTSSSATLSFEIFLLGLVASEVVGIMAEHSGGTRRYDGPLGKSDRAAAMLVMALALAFGLTNPALVVGYCTTLAIAVWYTTYRRFDLGSKGDTA